MRHLSIILFAAALFGQGKPNLPGGPVTQAADGSVSVGNTVLLDSGNYTTFALACAAAATAHAELLVSKTWPALASQTCSAPALAFSPLGILQPASGQTVTLSGSIRAGYYKIFDQSLGGTVTGFHAAEVYPQWWGAVCDGSTDDQPAFQAMVNAAPFTSNGSNIKLPTSGFCAFNSGVAITSKTQLHFIGNDTVLIANTGHGAFDFFTLSESSFITFESIVFAGQHLVGRGLVDTSASVQEGLFLRDVVFYQFANGGLYVAAITRTDMQRVSFTENGGTTYAGAYFGVSTDSVRVTACMFKDNHIGIEIYGSGQAEISGGTKFSNNAIGVWVVNSTYAVSIRNNLFEGDTQANIQWGNNTSAVPLGGDIRSNTIAPPNGGKGIDYQGGVNLSIATNVFIPPGSGSAIGVNVAVSTPAWANGLVSSNNYFPGGLLTSVVDTAGLMGESPTTLAVVVPASDVICAAGSDSTIAGVTCNNATDGTFAGGRKLFASTFALPSTFWRPGTVLQLCAQWALWSSAGNPSLSNTLESDTSTFLYGPTANVTPTGGVVGDGWGSCYTMISSDTGAHVYTNPTSAAPFVLSNNLIWGMENGNNGAVNLGTGSHTISFGLAYSSTGLATATYVSGGSFSGTGNCVLNTFNNGGASTPTATIAVSSNTPGAITVTATGHAFTSAPTTAVVANGTATCSGTITITSTLGGAQGNAIKLQSLTVTQLH